MKYLSIPLFIAIILVFSNCNDDNPKPNGNGDQKPEELEITSFKITNTNPVSVGEIDTITHDIYVNVPAFTDISKLMVEVEYTDSADLTPPSGYAYNFKEPLTFKVEKNDSTVEYVVYVNTSLSNENELKKIILPELRIEQLVTDTIDTINVSYGTKLTDVLVEFEISKNATVNPSSGSRIDFTQPQQIVVTSESGLEQTYTFNINEADQDIAVRAFWIPAPWHSPFLRSYDNILQGVALAKNSNLIHFL